MALRDYLSSKIVTFLLPLAISGCGTGNVKNGSQYCGSDMDCDGNQICSVTGTCIQEGACVVDLDCGGDLVCENGECLKPGTKKVYGGITPSETWNQFTYGLSKGNLEETLNYFDSASQYRQMLKAEYLPELAEEFKDSTFYDCTSDQKLKDCKVLVNGEVETFQFILNQENNQKIWKFRGF